MDKGTTYRNFKNGFFKGSVIALTAIATIPLVLILFYIFKQGISSINWNFLTQEPKPVGETGGGVYNAIIGSLFMIFVASVIAIPIGITTALYTKENPKTKIAYWTGIAVDVLQGIPSIVIGIIIYLWVVKPLGGFSAVSGSIALAFMMLPSIIRSAEETLKLIPDSLKEASLALGVPYYRTIMKVILPAGLSGILGGIILGIARISGETAPLLFTAFGNPYTNYNMLKPMSSLPHLIYNYAQSPYDDWHKLAWGASFLLIVFILILNIITKLVERKWKVQF
ncbi:MAG TPA: phosphate ABC transporter permease PstA [Bacteroidia bacterium]|jgi:phosphate transport system permease protein|nr:phosphate ABC transporter permease PstA [Bacteroidia bacterium]